jgi:hypothetical protein
MAGLRGRGRRALWLSGCLVAASALVVAGQGDAQRPAPDGPSVVAYAQQGWSEADRQTFYTTSQGSHIMPYAWFKALRRLDTDAPFAGDQLQRYGYLRNDEAYNSQGLPVGFVVDTRTQPSQIGMNCSACHTGQVEYQQNGVTKALRIDGAPASADFQQFLTDLSAAAQATLSQPARFDAFARTVLGDNYSADAASQLKTDLAAWVAQFQSFMQASLPTGHPWGPGRLDAFGMIFNRAAGRDLGAEENIKIADAPVSYPFLWNAHRQDQTQWNGMVPNGLFLSAMARNTGEVLGVFADFKPKVVLPGNAIIYTLIDYKNNSIDFDSLQTLEEKVASLKPPAWPRDVFKINDALAAQGKPLFDQYCSGCHAEQPSDKVPGAWKTPVLPVGSDPTLVMRAARTSDTAVYTDAFMVPPPFAARFGKTAATTDILKASVVGTILAEAVVPPVDPNNGVWRAINRDAANGLPAPAPMAAAQGDPHDPTALIQSKLSGLYVKPAQTAAVPAAAYESRVLYGVWATAPYLHNGSAPNLWELLTPPKQRKTSFMVGSRTFDPKNVGFATDRSPFRSGKFVADPANANGNGNQGHDYGTHLTSAQRWALIEYLKTL